VEDGINKQITWKFGVESETLQQDLLKFQEGRHVYVAASGGQISTPYMYGNCKRIRDTVFRHRHIKKSCYIILQRL
jgi:hypothetical protein